MNKEEKYKSLYKQAIHLISKDDHYLSSMSNLCALLISEFDHHWVGFYLVSETESELYLGPFQGPLACTKIPFAKGVCGEAWRKSETVIVDNVHEFTGHIACSSLSNSEIVVPLISNDKVIGVLDIDSKKYSDFDNIDKKYLELLVKHLASCL